MKYVVSFFIAIAILFIAVAIYDEVNKSGAKAQRLACHKESVVFERLVQPEMLLQVQDAIRADNVTLKIKTLPSKYMKSRLFKHVDIDKFRQNNIDTIESYVRKSDEGESKTTLELTIYENDKDDPGKKTPKSKLYAGYLIYAFLVNNKLVYKIQIDFFDKNGKDFPKQIKCAFASLMSLESRK